MLKKLRKALLSLVSFSKEHSLLAGIMPSLLLALVAVCSLQGTNDQISLLSEQLSYVRHPVLIIENQAKLDKDGWLTKDYIAVSNVGNDSAMNVFPKMYLFLLTDSQVYSYGQLTASRPRFVDRERPAKELIFPRRVLHPNQEFKLEKEFYRLLRKPLLNLKLASQDVLQRDFATVRNLLKGEYVLLVEVLYRRPIDLEARADTSYFKVNPAGNYFENLRLLIGGNKIIARVQNYLHNGPEMSIRITREGYTIFDHATNPPNTAITLPRNASTE